MNSCTTWNRILHYVDPDLCHETEEFIVEHDPVAGRYRYGNDGGCSCYAGFDPANFSETYDRSDVFRAFTVWAGKRYNVARAYEAFKLD